MRYIYTSIIGILLLICGYFIWHIKTKNTPPIFNKPITNYLPIQYQKNIKTPNPNFICKNNRKCFAYQIGSTKKDEKSPVILYFHGWYPYTQDSLLQDIYSNFISPLKKYNKALNDAPIVVILNGSIAPGPVITTPPAPYRGWNLANPTNRTINDYGKGYGTGLGYNAKNILTCLSDKPKQSGWLYPNKTISQCKHNTSKSTTCQWTGCSNELLYVHQVLNEVTAHFKRVDRSKIYVVGFSNGAMLTYILPTIMNQPNSSYKIAAIASYSGGIPYGLFLPKKLPPFIDFHGINDESVPGKTSRKKLISICKQKLNKIKTNNPLLITAMKAKAQKDFNLKTTLTNDELLSEYLSCDNVSTYQIVYNLDKVFEFVTGNKSNLINKQKLIHLFPDLKQTKNVEDYKKYDYITYSYDKNHILVEFKGVHQPPPPAYLGTQMTWDFLSKY